MSHGGGTLYLASIPRVDYHRLFPDFGFRGLNLGGILFS